MQNHQQPAPIAMKPLDAAKYIGLSRARVYELIAVGELTAKKYGRSTLVTTASMNEFIDRCQTAKFRATRAQERHAAIMAAESAAA